MVPGEFHDSKIRVCNNAFLANNLQINSRSLYWRRYFGSVLFVFLQCNQERWPEGGLM